MCTNTYSLVQSTCVEYPSYSLSTSPSKQFSKVSCRSKTFKNGIRPALKHSPGRARCTMRQLFVLYQSGLYPDLPRLCRQRGWCVVNFQGSTNFFLKNCRGLETWHEQSSNVAVPPPPQERLAKHPLSEPARTSMLLGCRDDDELSRSVSALRCPP